MKNKLKLGIVLSLLYFGVRTLNAQDTKGKRLYSGEIQGISFLKYPDNLQIKVLLSTMQEAKCTYPEDLMLSIMSCNNSDWEIYQTVGGKDNADIKTESHYAFIKSMNKDKNYFELKHKFEFDIMGVSTAVVNFRVYVEYRG